MQETNLNDFDFTELHSDAGPNNSDAYIVDLVMYDLVYEVIAPKYPTSQGLTAVCFAPV